MFSWSLCFQLRTLHWLDLHIFFMVALIGKDDCKLRERIGCHLEMDTQAHPRPRCAYYLLISWQEWNKWSNLTRHLAVFSFFIFFFLDLAFCDLYFRWGTNLHLISRVEFVSIIFPVIVPLYALWPTRPQYYKVIEECVSQVVLHRSGMDPDFGYSRRLDVDFTHLIGNLS